MPFNANNPYSLVSQVIHGPVSYTPPSNSVGKPKLVTPTDTDRMVALYESGMTQLQVARATGWSQNTVGASLRSRGVVMRARQKKAT